MIRVEWREQMERSRFGEIRCPRRFHKKRRSTRSKGDIAVGERVHGSATLADRTAKGERHVGEGHRHWSEDG